MRHGNRRTGAELAAGFRLLPDSTPKAWRFYGREAETAQLRAAFLAPEFDLVAIRGDRCVGKSRLLHEVVRGLPEDRPVAWHSAFASNTPEEARDNLLHSLDNYSVSGAGRKGISRLRDAASSLRSMPEILEYLLRGGVSVAVDWADRMQHDALSGLVQEIGDLARKLRREDAAIAGATGPLLARRGTLVLLGMAHIRMRELLDALGPSAVGRSILLEPWNGATLVTVARDRGWLEYPRRLALVRTALGGLPLDWERFAETPTADFAAWPEDGGWRLEFARYLIEKVVPDHEMTTWVMVRSEDPPEDWRILEYLARDEEKEIDTDAIHAAFRDVPPDRLDAWLAVMSEDLGLIEEVPGSGDKAGRRWRICDPRRRFWADVLRETAEEIRERYGSFFGRSTERLADRLRSLEDAALAQLKRECGPAWPSVPTGGPGARVRPLSRKTAPVERRAFAFDVAAPGVLEGMLIPYGVPMCIGGAFDEIFEPGSVLANGLLVNVRHDWGSHLARSGQGLELNDGPEGMRATVTLPDTIDGRRVRARIEAGELTAFSAAFQAIEEEWPAPPAEPAPPGSQEPAPPDRSPGQALPIRGDRRIVHRARLVGLALVDRPEHETPLVDGVRVRH